MWVSTICCKSYLTLKRRDQSLSIIAWRHFLKLDYASTTGISFAGASSISIFVSSTDGCNVSNFYFCCILVISSKSLYASPSPASPILMAFLNSCFACSTELIALKYFAKWKQMRAPARCSNAFYCSSGISKSPLVEFWRYCLPSRKIRALSNAWSITALSSRSVTAYGLSLASRMT